MTSQIPDVFGFFVIAFFFFVAGFGFRGYLVAYFDNEEAADQRANDRLFKNSVPVLPYDSSDTPEDFFQ